MVKPVVTKNVQQLLQEYASDTITPLIECDFKLHGVATYIKSCNMETFAKFSDGYKERYKDPDALINDRVVFQQLYKVTPYKPKQRPLKLEFTIDKGEFNSHPLLRIDPSSVFPKDTLKPQELFTLLVQEVNKIKAREGMMIGLYSDAMIQDLKHLVKKIYSKTFSEPAEVLLFDGIEPEIAEPSQLLLHFKNKSRDSKIQEVEPGELIVEYVKPIYGKDGLNANGKRISKGDMSNKDALSFDINADTIETKEDARRILLFSKKRGFVEFDDEHIEISNKIRLDKVKRVESKVAQEEENEVEVVIAQDDITEDSVGEGVYLTSEVINISGHVADKAKLEAKQLTIDGATHSGSLLYAKEATVNRHKGLLRCHKAHIKLLEGGEVHATHAHIDATMGGTVYAEYVTLGTVKHNLKVFATGSINIERLSGEDNHFTIDYQEIPIMMSRIKYIEADLAELSYQLEEAKRHTPENIEPVQQKINAFKQEIETIKNSCFDATINIEQPVQGLNTITFALPKNQKITFRTEEGKQYGTFYLEAIEENEAKLHPVNLGGTW